MKFSDNAICSVNVEEDSIQEELDKLQDWNNRNGMNLNNPKGEVRHFRTLFFFFPQAGSFEKRPGNGLFDHQMTQYVPVENTNVVLECIGWGTSSKDKYQCHFVTQIT